MARLTDETELYEQASDGKQVLRTNVIDGGVGTNVSVALAITAEDIGSGQYNATINFAADTIIDLMVLNFSPGGSCNSNIILEDNDNAAQFFNIQLNNNTSVVITDMNISMDPSKSLFLSIGQSPGCTVDGFIIQRT